jgi:MoaA/NifB/PqqE/SkfB family radical SAM enzyme
MPNLHLTSKRNQRDFAPAGALLADRPEPGWAEIETAVAAAGDAGPLYLIGGEPTLRRDLYAIVANLMQAFPEREVVLVTNGRLFFYERTCDTLDAAGVQRLTVEIAIASTRREVHDAVVGVAESFDQASRGIQRLVARGRHTRVRVLVGRHNIGHLHEIAAWVPDRFAGIERLVWDAATLNQLEQRDLGARPDEISSYLESAINLLRSRNMELTVLGMPECAISERYRCFLDRGILGGFRDACAPCDARLRCCGLAGTLVSDPGFRVSPISSKTGDRLAADYERYLTDLLARYVPEAARGGDFVLDAMCGRRLRNLPALRRFFHTARSVHATDIDADDAVKGPPGTSVFRGDARQPPPTTVLYAFIALFKPPDDSAGLMQQALTNLVAALQPGGHLMIVLAEHTDVEGVLETLRRLGVSVLVSEANALRGLVEPEHKWVIVCRAG